MTHIAYCYRSGEIEIAPRDGHPLPEGVIAFAAGPKAPLEEIISRRARHSKPAGLYLVPGLPEAEDGDAVTALTVWLDWAFGSFPRDEADRTLRMVS